MKHTERVGPIQGCAECERLNNMLNVERTLVTHLTNTREDLAVQACKALRAEADLLAGALEKQRGSHPITCSNVRCAPDCPIDLRKNILARYERFKNGGKA